MYMLGVEQQWSRGARARGGGCRGRERGRLVVVGVDEVLAGRARCDGFKSDRLRLSIGPWAGRGLLRVPLVCRLKWHWHRPSAKGSGQRSAGVECMGAGGACAAYMALPAAASMHIRGVDCRCRGLRWAWAWAWDNAVVSSASQVRARVADGLELRTYSAVLVRSTWTWILPARHRLTCRPRLRSAAAVRPAILSMTLWAWHTRTRDAAETPGHGSALSAAPSIHAHGLLPPLARVLAPHVCPAHPFPLRRAAVAALPRPRPRPRHVAVGVLRRPNSLSP